MNNLYIMCEKTITRPFTMFCYTDNYEGIDKRVNIVEYVENNFDILVYNKMFLFSKTFNDHLPDGDRLYFDLDLIIKSNIDDIVSYQQGDLTLIEAEWRPRWDYGFPVFHHPFNSSCMTWKTKNVQKIWDYVIRDPEHFMTKYRWGMDSFLFYEKESIGVNIQYFPCRKFYSALFGIDIAENLIYDPIELAYRESKLKHVADKIPIVLLNGPTTPDHYNHLFKKYHAS